MRKKKQKKYWFIQKGGTYPSNVLVVVGWDFTDFAGFSKQKNTNPDYIPFIARNKDFINDSVKNAYGFVLTDGIGTASPVLWLKTFEDTWDFYLVLIHETHHLVHRTLGESRGMSNELEALAYQQEYFVKHIREKLYKRYVK